jgi:muramoyltetrapeptide carboxypeptidase
VVAPCGPFERSRFDAGLEVIRAAGFRPTYSEGIFARDRYLAGDDDRRAGELLTAIEDPQVRAIWVARGGYGATRITPRIDAEAVRRNPKWLVGFSDVTALHGVWARAGLASLHGPNVTTLPEWSEEARQAVWGWLQNAPTQHFAGRTASGRGTVEGVLRGGNLSILAALVGTGLLPSLRHAILLLEDVGERPYRLDRALHQLFHSGAFEGVIGFVIGQLTDCEEPPERATDYDARSVVEELLASWDFPVLADVSIGHEPTSLPVALGTWVTLDLDSGTLAVRGRS